MYVALLIVNGGQWSWPVEGGTAFVLELPT